MNARQAFIVSQDPFWNTVTSKVVRLSDTDHVSTYRLPEIQEGPPAYRGGAQPVDLLLKVWVLNSGNSVGGHSGGSSCPKVTEFVKVMYPQPESPEGYVAPGYTTSTAATTVATTVPEPTPVTTTTEPAAGQGSTPTTSTTLAAPTTTTTVPKVRRDCSALKDAYIEATLASVQYKTRDAAKTVAANAAKDAWRACEAHNRSL
jgi:hypothetical protein